MTEYDMSMLEYIEVLQKTLNRKLVLLNKQGVVLGDILADSLEILTEMKILINDTK